VTRPEHSRVIQEMLKGQRRVRLSKAAFEVLAVIAYRQPCTRVDIENVRGVNCGGPLATLHERGLVRITGRAETLGRPLLYATTDEFLAHLGINDLQDLPRMSEIQELLRPEPEGDEQEPLAAHRRALLEQAAGIDALVAQAGGNGNGNGNGSSAAFPAPSAETDAAEPEAADETEEGDESEALAQAIRVQYEQEREALARSSDEEGTRGDAAAGEESEELLEESEP